MIAFFLIILGCFTGPPSIDEWRAEILHGSRISDDADLKMPILTKGRTEVLWLFTEWGKLPIITDTQTYAELMLVPAFLDAGTSFSAADRRGVFRMGGMEVSYESRELEGTIRVIESTPKATVLDIDIWARTPVIDLRSRGEKHIVGRVRATHRQFGEH